MASVGTPERPLKVAIVGAGPSGFYAAQALFAAGRAVQVDVLDRLPTPYGLVRGGVAPDHQNIKAVIRAYDKVAKCAGFRYFGNVRLGVDVSLDQLLAAYDQVVLATGCESANPLGCPGEDLLGSHSATEFVGWYNGHPDHRDREFDLSARAAVVVGVGNVAMDVTRVLVQDRDVLAKTDIATHALEVLRDAKVTDVYVLGRRGAAQAAFSPGELKEIAEIEGVDLVVRPEDVELDPASAAWVAQANDKQVNQTLALLRELAGRPLTKPRRVHLWLNTSPVAILGEGGRVTAVEVGRNRIEDAGDGRFVARDTGERARIEAGLVFRAIGYRGTRIPGVPFDERSGTIPNAGGRVTRERDGAPVDRLYVVGWAKRGPQGLIGTNRADSKDTVDKMLKDLEALPTEPRVDLGLSVTTDWADWERLDAHEVQQGESCGKIREKFVRIADMLGHLDRD